MHKIVEQKFNPSIFKAYDIRGRYPDEINEVAAYAIARAFAEYLRLRKRAHEKIAVVLSLDARKSSPELKEAFLEGLLKEGIEVIDAGFTTTPMHHFIVHTSYADGGVMITASHNPPEFNGIKLSLAGAIPIGEGQGMEEIRGMALRGIFQDSKESGKVVQQDFLEAYIDFYEKRFSHLVSFECSFIADAGNGMTSLLLHKLFSRFPKFRVEYLDDVLDMTFPHHEANPLKASVLRDVQSEVVKKHCDFAVSFDGDGDRIGFVDEKGDIIPADLITAFLVRRFADKGAVMLYDVRSSRVVQEEAERFGVKSLENRVGHTFMKLRMREKGALFGGELSGHYYFKDFFYADSAIFALFSFLEVLRKEKKLLSACIAPLRRYWKSEEMNFSISRKDYVIDALASRFSDGVISYLDGIKVEYADWWFNVRPSNTENLVRFNLEAKSADLFKEKKELLVEFLGSFAEKENKE